MGEESRTRALGGAMALIGLVIACDNRPSASKPAADVASTELDSTVAATPAPPAPPRAPPTLSTGEPQFQPGCIDDHFAPALARVTSKDSLLTVGPCADETLLYAEAKLGRHSLLAVIRRSTMWDNALYVDKRRFQGGPDIEKLERALGGRAALARLSNADAATLLSLARVLWLRGGRPRFAFSEPDARALAPDWPPIAGSVDTRGHAVQPERLHLVEDEKEGRVILGWYEGLEDEPDGPCRTLYEIETALRPSGELYVMESSLASNGPGCPVYPPETQNFFPD